MSEKKILSINQDLLCSFHIINPVFSKEKKKKEKINKFVNWKNFYFIL